MKVLTQNLCIHHLRRVTVSGSCLHTKLLQDIEASATVSHAPTSSIVPLGLDVTINTLKRRRHSFAATVVGEIPLEKLNPATSIPTVIRRRRNVTMLTERMMLGVSTVAHRDTQLTTALRESRIKP